MYKTNAVKKLNSTDCQIKFLCENSRDFYGVKTIPNIQAFNSAKKVKKASIILHLKSAKMHCTFFLPILKTKKTRKK